MLFAYKNLLISFAICYDIHFACSTFNFHIFLLRFGSRIIPCIPYSGVGRKTQKLIPLAARPSRPLVVLNRIVDTHTLIILVVFQHSPGYFLAKFELRLMYCLPPTCPGVYVVGLFNRANKIKLSCRPTFCVSNLLKTNIIMPPIIHITDPMLAVIVMGEIIGVLERHQLLIFLTLGEMVGHFVV